MKVALAQINPTIGDFEKNVARVIDFGKRAASAGARLVIYPELAICGYPPMDLLLKESFVKANLDSLERVKNALPELAVLIGYVDPNPGTGRPVYNACALLDGGQLRAVQHKTLLPTYDVFDEDRYFEPAKSYTHCSVD